MDQSDAQEEKSWAGWSAAPVLAGEELRFMAGLSAEAAWRVCRENTAASAEESAVAVGLVLIEYATELIERLQRKLLCSCRWDSPAVARWREDLARRAGNWCALDFQGEEATLSRATQRLLELTFTALLQGPLREAPGLARPAALTFRVSLSPPSLVFKLALPGAELAQAAGKIAATVPWLAWVGGQVKVFPDQWLLELRIPAALLEVEALCFAGDQEARCAVPCHYVERACAGDFVVEGEEAAPEIRVDGERRPVLLRAEAGGPVASGGTALLVAFGDRRAAIITGAVSPPARVCLSLVSGRTGNTHLGVLLEDASPVSVLDIPRMLRAKRPRPAQPDSSSPVSRD